MIRRQIFIVGFLTAIAQAAGFFKLWIIARQFGIGPLLDGYFLALVVPTLISGVLSGMLQTSLFPVRAKFSSKNGKDSVYRFERGVLVLLLVVGVAVAGFVFIAGPEMIEWSGSRLTLSVYEAALFVLPFAVVLIPLNIFSDGLGYLLAMRDRYPIAAGAPIANTLFGSALLVLWPAGGLLNLALGTVIGVVLQVGICLIGLSRTGFYIFGALPARDEMHQEWREMINLSAWIFPGVIFANLTATLPIILIAAYGEGVVSAFSYAWKFHQFAIQLLIMAASPILLAHIANLVALGNEIEIRRLLMKSLWFSLGVGSLAVAIVAMFGGQLLVLVFGGKFDAVTANQVSGYWLWLTYALAPALLGNVCAKVWQARGRAGLISSLAGFGLVVFLLINQMLSDALGSYAVVAAIGVSSLAIVLVGWHAAWKSTRFV